MSNWISVKERLPDDNERVLVYISGMDFFINVLSGWAVRTRREVNGMRVYWMPLPKLPKPCDTCENNGWNMPQCRECNEQNEYKWFRREEHEEA